MKRRMLIGGVLLSLCGCSSMNNTERGLLGGGIVGGALGTAVGAALGDPLAGAAIGAGAGAAVGGLSGNAEDQHERKMEVQQAHAVADARNAAQTAAANAPPLEEIVRMTKAGVPEANIIHEIRNSGAVYKLNSDHLIYLSQNGVSSQVIAEMQNGAPRQHYAVQPAVYAPPRTVYVYESYPPPPPRMTWGVGFSRGYGCRHW